MDPEPTHAELLAEIRVQGAVLQGIDAKVDNVSKTLASNTSRLASVEKWIESHDAIVRFVKWTLAIIVAIASPIIAFWAMLKGKG